MSSQRSSRCAPNRRRTDRGSAVITVLVLAAVTAVISSSFLFRAAGEARLATRSVFMSVALNLAEAGVEEALYAVNSSTVNGANGWTLASGSTTDYVKSITSGFEFQQATGAIYMRVDNAALTPTVTVAAVVSIPNQRPILKQLRVGSTGPVKLWANGIVSKGAVTFGGSADVDSYDSSLGAYNTSTNRTDRATVASNSTIQLTGSATVYGYVATGGTAPSVGDSGRIYGATSPGTPLVDPTRVRTDFNTNLQDATAPTSTAISLGAYSVGSSSTAVLPRLGDLPGLNGRYLYTCTSLSVSGSATLRVMGPVDIIVTGDMSVGGSGTLAIGGTGSVSPSLNVYCPGTITIGGSGMVNDTSLPVNTTIWGTTPTGSTQVVTVAGSAAYNGTIYAPNGNIVLGGSGSVYGAVIGSTVRTTGSADLHYDVQLGTTVSAAGPTPGSGNGTGYARVTSWTELTGSPTGGSAFARDNREPFSSLF